MRVGNFEGPVLRRSRRLRDALERRGAAVRRALVYDGAATVDTFRVHGARIKEIMREAGYRLARESDCPHWDGVDGYRLEFERRA